MEHEVKKFKIVTKAFANIYKSTSPFLLLRQRKLLGNDSISINENENSTLELFFLMNHVDTK